MQREGEKILSSMLTPKLLHKEDETQTSVQTSQMSLISRIVQWANSLSEGQQFLLLLVLLLKIDIMDITPSLHLVKELSSYVENNIMQLNEKLLNVPPPEGEIDQYLNFVKSTAKLVADMISSIDDSPVPVGTWQNWKWNQVNKEVDPKAEQPRIKGTSIFPMLRRLADITTNTSKIASNYSSLQANISSVNTSLTKVSNALTSVKSDVDALKVSFPLVIKSVAPNYSTARLNQSAIAANKSQLATQIGGEYK